MSRIEKVRILWRAGASLKQCSEALDACDEDLDKAREWLIKNKPEIKVKEAGVGVIATHVHNGRIGVMIELRTATDFAANSAPFKDLHHELLLQLIAGLDGPFERQFLCKHPSLRVEELVDNTIKALGEPVKIARCIRWEVGK